jgi:superfamily II helicase
MRAISSAGGRGVLWTSQLQGIDRLRQESSFALCTPTGSGKTLIANLALVRELLLREADGLAPLAMYLVPSRALAGEVEAKLRSELGRDMTVTRALRRCRLGDHRCMVDRRPTNRTDRDGREGRCPDALSRTDPSGAAPADNCR